MKSVGIVGGLGPATTAEFYMKLIRKFRTCRKFYPSVTIDNVSFPFSFERDIIRDAVNEEKLLPYIKESVRRLNRSGVNFIAIPCNTVHIFIEELRKTSSAPIISIIDETAKHAKKSGYRRIGLLATTKTVKSKIYEISLKEKGLETILPEKDDQRLISDIILRILNGKTSASDKCKVGNIIARLAESESEAIILGCTDMNQLIEKDENILDSTEILLQSVFNRMNNEYKHCEQR